VGRERKMWKNSHIEAKNAANSRLLARFLTKIWGILIIFIRDAISCKGLYKYYETFARPPQNLTDFENRHFFEVNLAFGSFLAEYLSF